MVPPHSATHRKEHAWALGYPQKTDVNQTPATNGDPADAQESPITVTITPQRQARPRLHEPFVSPEFSVATERPGGIHPADNAFLGNDSARWCFRPDALPTQQAAPLSTVLPASATHADSILLAKRLAVSAAGRASVVSSPCDGQGGGNIAIAPSSGAMGVLSALGGEQEQHTLKPHCAPIRDSSGTGVAPNGKGQNITRPQQQMPPGDLSSLVAQCSCTWGSDVGSILGLHMASSTGASRRSAVVTTGLFPQTIRLRYIYRSCERTVTYTRVAKMR